MERGLCFGHLDEERSRMESDCLEVKSGKSFLAEPDMDLMEALKLDPDLDYWRMGNHKGLEVEKME
jgi:hypothetical protein